VDKLWITCEYAVGNLWTSEIDRGGGVVLACKSYGCPLPSEKAKLKYNIASFPKG
jgi:hypothetical protein